MTRVPDKFPTETMKRTEQDIQDLLARRAHELFERRGGEHGRDVEDWLEAQRLVAVEIGTPGR